MDLASGIWDLDCIQMGFSGGLLYIASCEGSYSSSHSFILYIGF